MYDSYIKAFRWGSNIIGEKGVVCYVTNASFIDSNSTKGLRKYWNEEFNYVYVFNLRGDARTQGEQRKKEGGNIFGGGSRTPVAITLLIKDGSSEHKVFYYDIGDYKGQDEKLSFIKNACSIDNIEWEKINPDENFDWINQRDKNYQRYDSMLGDVFYSKSDGVQTNRDAWVYNFSTEQVRKNSIQMIENYNNELKRLENYDKDQKVELLNTSGTFISWSRALKKKIQANKFISSDLASIQTSMYRPYVKKHLFYLKDILEYPRDFENEYVSKDNLGILVPGVGAKREFSAIIVDVIPDFNMLEAGVRGFFENTPEPDESLQLFTSKSNITDSFANKLGLTKKQAFFYIYGLIHSPEYRKKYAYDLRKELPRVPIVSNKDKFVGIGEKLADLHLSYEVVEPYPDLEIIYKNNSPSYRVQKMKHLKKGVLDTIIFNNDITIKKIPEKAYEYIVNGKPAIQWIIDQYQVKTDKKSGIADDPNLYSDDERYIFDLLLRIINVSVQTVDLVNSLPPLEIVDVDLK